ncbi:hypothetical protein H310_00759 [Aphanomyces invadans]|uniref:Uncharacterized protein n=1 Tax=Aphanomyces invadans TaxID=157072 RepID=A0A024UWX0_9STRA|nr:hypothetical protein H310_00759 [Aphanomyces invadans]ETW10455.1 hypothetical protein H310_00759 [Aphanomyces invadans]|eukprot:XP_008861866.1 hypothetical protein H310_00759 [Aphanomyces invadans]
MSLLTSWKEAMSRATGSGGDSDSNDDTQQDGVRTGAFPGEENDENEQLDVGASTIPAPQGGAVNIFFRRLSSLGKPTKDKIEDDTNGRPQDSPSPPSNRRRWSLRKFTDDPFKAIRMTKDDEAVATGTDGSQQPSPTNSSHRHLWSLLPKLTESLNNAKLEGVATPDDNHQDSHDAPKGTPRSAKTSPVNADPPVIVVDKRCIRDIQSEAQRVCSVISGDVKRHLKILRSIDPTNPVLADIKAAIAEANVWLAECIAPTDGSEDDRLKLAKITQQFHAERCLLHSNTMARNEINRLSDLATKNAVAARRDHPVGDAAPTLHRTRSF